MKPLIVKDSLNEPNNVSLYTRQLVSMNPRQALHLAIIVGRLAGLLYKKGLLNQADLRFVFNRESLEVVNESH